MGPMPPRRPTSHGGLVALALLLALLNFGAGWFAIARRPASGNGPAPTSTAGCAAPPTLPRSDVLGADIAGLPRYPGAIREHYRRVDQGELLLTDAHYLTPAPLDAVHDFYREVFHNQGWTEADLDFSQGRRRFFVIAGAREANVTLAPRGALTAIAIEVSEPRATPDPTTAPLDTPAATANPAPAPAASPAPAATAIPVPAPGPPAAPPPADDDDEDGGDAGDGGEEGDD